MLKIHQYAIMCAPTTSQYAAVEALRNGDRDVEEMREAYDQRRRFLVKALRDMGLDCYEPQGAFYVFPCIKKFGRAPIRLLCGFWSRRRWLWCLGLPLETAERDI